MEKTPKEKREIKFRAWDGEKMIYDFLVARPQFTDPLKVLQDEKFAQETYNVKEWKIMQFVGFNGIGGKSIYEGDIVKWDDLSKGGYWRVAVVEWGIGEIRLRIIKNTIHELSTSENKIFDFGSFTYQHQTEKHIHLLGNIYENPSLLK